MATPLNCMNLFRRRYRPLLMKIGSSLRITQLSNPRELRQLTIYRGWRPSVTFTNLIIHKLFYYGSSAGNPVVQFLMPPLNFSITEEAFGSLTE